MVFSRRLFIESLITTLLFPSIPAFSLDQAALTTLPLPAADRIHRVISAGSPADMLLLAVAPEKLVGFSSFDFLQQAAIPLPASIRHLPRLGKLAGRGSTLSLEKLLTLKPDVIVDCGNVDESWRSLARRTSEQTHIPWLLVNGGLRQSPAQLRITGNALGQDKRVSEQAQLAEHFIDEATAFARTPAAGMRFYAARGARGLETGLQGSLHTEAAELLGLQNVAQIPGRSGLSLVSMENLLKWQPDLILVQDAVTARYLRQDPVWQGVNAVARGKILFLGGLPFGWLDAPPGINRLLGLRRLHAWLDGTVNSRFKDDMLLYSRLFWHTPLSETDYHKLVVNA